MKCPKCGFISFPGLTECKKCGHRFALSASEDPSSLLEPLDASPESALEEIVAVDELSLETAPSAEVDIPEVEAAETPAGEAESPLEPLIHTAEPLPGAAPLIEPEPVLKEEPDSPATWREEISERVESFRRRRARLQGPEAEESLAFDFESAEETEPPPPGAVVADNDAGGWPAEPEMDLAAGTPASVPFVDAIPLDRPAAVSPEGSDIAFEAGLEAPGRGEVLLDTSQPLPPPIEPEPAPIVLPLAPLGRRFLAGLLDALVLLAAAGLFALIFWRAGGKMAMQPLNLAVVAVIAAFILLAYFGLFTGLAGTTPGLLWMGLEIRNLDGEFPTPLEAAWRAFGYLISASAVMLGFVWALVDTDGFTWHDRMSGTCITLAEGEPSVASLPFAH